MGRAGDFCAPVKPSLHPIDCEGEGLGEVPDPDWDDVARCHYPVVAIEDTKGRHIRLIADIWRPTRPPAPLHVSAPRGAHFRARGAWHRVTFYRQSVEQAQTITSASTVPGMLVVCAARNPINAVSQQVIPG